jgi:hypothetical protein
MADDPAFESVITEEMRTMIGVEGPPQIHEVTTTGVRMFARAVAYGDPVFYDREEAQRRGYRDLPAPAGYLGTAVYNPVSHDPTFGARRDAMPGVRSPYSLRLNGGNDVEYFDEDICAGDVLTATNSVETLTERYSRALGGPMLIVVTATKYVNQDGKLVAIMRNTGISYGPKLED